ncbi:hypothetical protein B0H67DRAFT_6166 [Lasiosphaeris hirsuta]|uniref:Uncharacterized protein n=1 Tax=Lasiosphaeris hirsuta TaxID=260670 RepID=A0AA40B8P4_9PEZI|nr:hypothetical protein B0H67DRAFT_6166 [Lasiosphaeris hirsuta]
MSWEMVMSSNCWCLYPRFRPVLFLYTPLVHHLFNVVYDGGIFALHFSFSLGLGHRMGSGERTTSFSLEAQMTCSFAVPLLSAYYVQFFVSTLRVLCQGVAESTRHIQSSPNCNMHVVAVAHTPSHHPACFHRRTVPGPPQPIMTQNKRQSHEVCKITSIPTAHTEPQPGKKMESENSIIHIRAPPIIILPCSSMPSPPLLDS